MNNQKLSFKTEQELQQVILREKSQGTPDAEIGQKYGVTFRYIERLITRTQGLNVSALKGSKKIKRFQPKDFKEEQTTVWSFKQRGRWATHSGEYRGNWSPYIPRNVILKYSKPGELVLDYFCGAGTTAVEAKLLGRRCLAFDINDKAIELARKNVNFSLEPGQLILIENKSSVKVYEPELSVGDARDLSFLPDNSVDLICAHPPYANIIHYTDSKGGDLSFFDIDDFLQEMAKVARESYRVLKPGRQCAILIGDTRREKHIIPLGFKLINVYLDAGFKLRELVIKRQHNCKTTGFWYANSIKYNFLLLAHEYLPIFEKPAPIESGSLKAPDASSTKKEEAVIPAFRTSQLSQEEKPEPSPKLDELETTTVWILPEEDFEKHLNRNVIDRYSKGLLFIKSPFLNNPQAIESYLKELKKFVEQNLPYISNGGSIVIQTQDVRKDGYLEPLANKVVDRLTLDNLWLKEIVVVTKEGVNLDAHEEFDPDLVGVSDNLPSEGKTAHNDYLKIVHQYLLVYEVQ